MTQRIRVLVRGAVQGVGFRPFIYRLAHELHLHGWVINSPQGVTIEVEGAKTDLEAFLLRIGTERPPRAMIEGLEYSTLDPAGYKAFEIRTSDATGERSAFVLPDIALCPDCLRELNDPADRRHRYPFINCTHCGPRYSIILGLPYDRPLTTMRAFTMCAACQAEYHDPLNRRFHAQPNACPVCGPHLALWDARGAIVAERDDALRATQQALRDGRIAAVKGIGGFHLMARADVDEPVRILRERKHREEKPFAVMMRSLEMVRAVCTVSPLEERSVCSPEAPIVLLQRSPESDAPLSPLVAPGNPTVGVMLPYTPLHHLLLQDLDFPLIATSGNLSDEPICIDEREACNRLREIADVYLVHNRPIHRHVDDSVVRVVLDRELILRRARGFAPLPVSLPVPVGELLAVGAHLKNTVTVARGTHAFISQHLGDLETPAAYETFRQETASLQMLYRIRPGMVVSDPHPDYLSTGFARSTSLPLVSVQHHVAHVAACMADNDVKGTVLGVSWDGTGLGPDGTIWGGEFLKVGDGTFRRVAALRQFQLPGGDSAAREPRRAAFGLLYAMLGDAVCTTNDIPALAAFSIPERTTLLRMIERKINAPVTSSAGRLFDAVSAIAGIRQRNAYEGQGAMELEFAALGKGMHPYRYGFLRNGKGDEAMVWADWGPAVEDIIADVRGGVSRHDIAARFHATLASLIVAVARFAGQPRVMLTGGCFQNRLLTELTVRALQEAGFHPYWHQRIPPNDGGISAGQAAFAAFAAQESARTESGS